MKLIVDLRNSPDIELQEFQSYQRSISTRTTDFVAKKVVYCIQANYPWNYQEIEKLPAFMQTLFKDQNSNCIN